MSTTPPEDLLTMAGTLHGIAYAVVARQLERQRVVLDTLQVGGQPVPLTGSPTFGSLQAAVDIGSKLAEQYIGGTAEEANAPALGPAQQRTGLACRCRVARAVPAMLSAVASSSITIVFINLLLQ